MVHREVFTAIGGIVSKELTIGYLVRQMQELGHCLITEGGKKGSPAKLRLVPGTQILEAQCATCLQTAQYDAATKKVSGNAMTATCTHKGLTSREGRLMYYRTPSNAARR